MVTDGDLTFEFKEKNKKISRLYLSIELSSVFSKFDLLLLRDRKNNF